MFDLSAESPNLKPKPAQPGRLSCQPQPAERAKNCPVGTCRLSPETLKCKPKTWPLGRAACHRDADLQVLDGRRTQRPRGLMTSVARHLHPWALGWAPNFGGDQPVASDQPTPSELTNSISAAYLRLDAFQVFWMFITNKQSKNHQTSSK